MQNTMQVETQTRRHHSNLARGGHSAERNETGAPISPEMIEEYLAVLQDKGRVKGTLEWYRRSLRRLYEELPEQDKHIYRDTLRNWREKLMREEYAPATINQSMAVLNGYLDYIGRREYQIVEKLTLSEELQPEMSRTEYLRLLQTARALGRERIYLIVKVFANTGLPLQELPKVTVEAVQEGRINITYNHIKQIVRIPDCVRQELLSYGKQKGILQGPIFLNRDGEPMSRTNVSNGIRQLCVAAKVPEEKGNPRCLRKLYLSTREGIERNIALLVEQAQERMLEQEQLTIGWENFD